MSKHAPHTDVFGTTNGPGTGAILISLAMLVFTVMSGMIKATAPEIPPGQAVFFRSIFALPIILAWLAQSGELRTGLKTTNPWNHLVRGLAGSCAMGLGFAGLAYLPLPEVTAIRFVTPIVVVVLAAIILSERIRVVRITAVAIGMLGVLIILWPRLAVPGGGTEALGAIMILASACLAALAQVFIKAMAGRESTAAIVFYFSLTAATLSLFTVPFGWVWPTGFQLTMLIGAGLIGGVGQILLTSSYRFAEAGALAPFTYTSMIWALLIGWFWFAEVPTLQMMLGAGLIIVAGGVIVWRERVLGRGVVSEAKVRMHGKL